MSFANIAPRLFIGSLGDFGDANAIQATNIKIAVALAPITHHPHGSAPGSVGILIMPDGASPDWWIKGLARMLAHIYATGNGNIALCDQAGGKELAAFLLACARAEQQALSYILAKAWMLSLIPDANVPSALDIQGMGIWN